VKTEQLTCFAAQVTILQLNTSCWRGVDNINTNNKVARFRSVDVMNN